MKVLGIIIMLIGIALGIYISLYLMLFCGIIQIVENIDPLNAKEVAIGAFRVIFCEVGSIPAAICVIIGMVLMGEK